MSELSLPRKCDQTVYARVPVLPVWQWKEGIPCQICFLQACDLISWLPMAACKGVTHNNPIRIHIKRLSPWLVATVKVHDSPLGEQYSLSKAEKYAHAFRSCVRSCAHTCTHSWSGDIDIYMHIHYIWKLPTVDYFWQLKKSCNINWQTDLPWMIFGQYFQVPPLPVTNRQVVMRRYREQVLLFTPQTTRGAVCLVWQCSWLILEPHMSNTHLFEEV